MPITAERANRCLARIDLLSKIREQILWHPRLDERLSLCQLSSYFPDWWICGLHDKDLLVGAAKLVLTISFFLLPVKKAVYCYNSFIYNKGILKRFKKAHSAKFCYFTFHYVYYCYVHCIDMYNGSVELYD